MYKITVVALSGCELCATLAESLKSINIEFGVALASEHEALCDMLEVLLKTTKYPIVTIDTPDRVYFACMPNDYDRLGWKVLDDTSTSIGVNSLPEILDVIKEFKNK